MLLAGSMHSLVASPYKSAYNAAKHGIAGFTKTVALETAQTGVTCNAICPGYMLALRCMLPNTTCAEMFCPGYMAALQCMLLNTTCSVQDTCQLSNACFLAPQVLPRIHVSCSTHACQHHVFAVFILCFGDSCAAVGRYCLLPAGWLFR